MTFGNGSFLMARGPTKVTSFPDLVVSRRDTFRERANPLIQGRGCVEAILRLPDDRHLGSVCGKHDAAVQPIRARLYKGNDACPSHTGDTFLEQTDAAVMGMLRGSVQNSMRLRPPAIGRECLSRFITQRLQHWEAFFQPTQIDQPQSGGCPETAQGAFLELVKMAASGLPAKQRFVQRSQLSIGEIGSRFI